MHNNRIARLIAKFKHEKIDALLVTKPENIFYLTSFHTDKAALIVGRQKAFLVVDFIYAEAAIETVD